MPGSKYKGPSSNEWYTPGWCLEAVRNVLGAIDLDPASREEANARVQAKAYFDAEQNGLAKPWHGRVFVNPPYSGAGARTITEWVDKVLEERQGGRTEQTILLLNAATETGYGSRALREADAVCFPKGRMKFVAPGGERSGAQIGQMLLYYAGREDTGKARVGAARFVQEFGKHGPAWTTGREMGEIG